VASGAGSDWRLWKTGAFRRSTFGRGPTAAFWSTASYWTNTTNGSHAVPCPSDFAEFSRAAGGANTASIDNIASLTITGLVVDSSYTTTVSITQNLTIFAGEGPPDSSLGGGDIDISGGARLKLLGSTFDWTGGTLSEGGIFQVIPYVNRVISIGATFNIEGSSSTLDMDTHLENSNVNSATGPNRGTVDWFGPTQVDMSNGEPSLTRETSTSSRTGNCSVAGPGFITCRPGL
jgi:hypothetical protein